MNRLNVFNNPYYRWRYPDCWIKNARMFFKSFKYAYQRITKGYANCDTFDLDSYYLDIFSGTLNYLADNHCGYPGNDEFPTDESWTIYLKELAYKFYLANESNEAYSTPEADKWWGWNEKHPNDKISNNPYIEAMHKEEQENSAKREANLREGLKMLEACWKDLWD